MRLNNIVAGVFLTALGLVYGYLTMGLPERSLPNMPGPSFFPWIITVCLVSLSVALLIQGLRTPAKAPGPETPKGAAAPTFVFLGIFIVYLAVLPLLGFLLASIPFFAVLMVLFGETRKLWIASFSIGVSVFLFLLFRDVFTIPMPRSSIEALNILSATDHALTPFHS